MFALPTIRIATRSVALAGILTAILLLLASTAVADEPFGIEAFDAQVAANPAGDTYTQGGGHPYDFKTQFRLNRRTDPIYGYPWPSEPVKDIVVDTPPGFVGNPTVVAKCTLAELAVDRNETVNGPLCPEASQVGVFTVVQPVCFTPTLCFGFKIGKFPVFAMVAPPGVPARFGFNASSAILLDAKVRSGGDYGISVVSKNVTEGIPVIGGEITFWGTPADPANDLERSCPGESPPSQGGTHCPAGIDPKPFFTMPTSCNGPITTTIHADSWPHPDTIVSTSVESHLPPGLTPYEAGGLEPSLVAPDEWGAKQSMTGCELLPFSPTFSASPDTASSPGLSGWSFDLSMPLEGLEEPNGLAEANLKKAVVTLPAGVRVSPSSATGLGACSPTQIALNSSSSPTCPDSAKVGTVKIDTPLLEAPLTGSVYLATPHENPTGSLIGLYIVAEGSGVVIKLPGSVDLNPDTGQLSATFDDNPQLPFSKLHLEFFGGSRAPLSNPPRCGTYTTTAVMTAWNDKTATSTSNFTTTHDGQGAPCPPAQFKPGFTAGTSTPNGSLPNAGGFSTFALQLTRADDDSELQSLAPLSLPRGLLADIGSVTTRCTIDQADAAACPAASHIGELAVGAGPGTNPYYVKGDIYLTNSYKGNPFGIAVIVHALAGPFDLGYVVVKGGIQINDDGSASVTTDRFPTILQGIPLQLRDIRVNIDRPHFILNPTNCNTMSVNGTVGSTDGQTANVSNRFQIGECANLSFHLSFRVSTSAKASRVNGASLDARLSFPRGAFGREANVARVKVELPRQLPSRLTTLQKACPAGTFEANPAACPAASRVGVATASTPILSARLSGPAYFVSHGGAAFPDLTIVLQGEGVTIHLVGTTFISKAGITSTTFKQVPDVPVSAFELKLPQGRYSALAAQGDLCKAKLVLPTLFVAQNGAVIRRATPLAVNGCKAAIMVLAHKVSGSTARIVASVPSAGKLVATGAGIASVAATVKAAGRATLALTLSPGEKQFLARHPGRRLQVKVRLRFTPPRGIALSSAVTLLLG